MKHRSSWRVTWVMVVALALTLVGGCGGDDDDEAASNAATASGSAATGGEVPACAMFGTPVARPDAFPASIPLPDGTVIMEVTDQGEGKFVLHAAVPGGFRDTVTFLQTSFEEAGFRLFDDDAEQDEAEASYEGNGLTGRWRLRTIPDCPDALSFEISARPS